MSVHISSSPSSVQTNAVQANTKTIRQDFQNLATAPTSGDLAGAKDAFSAIQKLLQSPESSKAGPPQGNGAKPKHQLSTDLVAFGKALISGNLGAAQDSVKSLLGDIEAARGRYQPQAQGGDSTFNSITPSAGAGRPAGGKAVGSLINTTA